MEIVARILSNASQSIEELTDSIQVMEPRRWRQSRCSDRLSKAIMQAAENSSLKWQVGEEDFKKMLNQIILDHENEENQLSNQVTVVVQEPQLSKGKSDILKRTTAERQRNKWEQRKMKGERVTISQDRELGLANLSPFQSKDYRLRGTGSIQLKVSHLRKQKMKIGTQDVKDKFCIKKINYNQSPMMASLDYMKNMRGFKKDLNELSQRNITLEQTKESKKKRMETLGFRESRGFRANTANLIGLQGEKLRKSSIIPQIRKCRQKAKMIKPTQLSPNTISASDKVFLPGVNSKQQSLIS